MSNKQTMSINKNYYDKYNCKFAFCESCYWVATILLDKFNINHCYNCNKKKYSYRNNINLEIVYRIKFNLPMNILNEKIYRQ